MYEKMRKRENSCAHLPTSTEERYLVATISMLLKIIGLLCKRAL